MRTALLAALSAACWFGWFAWDSTYQTDPATGVTSGPYEAWQVVGCVVSVGVVVVVATRRLGPLRVVATTAPAFTIAWAVTAASQDPTGLWLVGAVLVLIGVTAGAGLLALVTTAVTKNRGRVLQRFHVVPAAYVLLERAGVDGTEVLLQLRRGTGYMDGHWAFGAAGHVEAGESVHAAAVREAREELAVRIAPEDLLPLTAMHRTHGNGRAIDERVDFFFVCRRWEGEPYAVEDTKAADLRWTPLDRLDELGAPVVPHERAVLDGLRRRDLPPVVTFGFGQGS